MAIKTRYEPAETIAPPSSGGGTLSERLSRVYTGALVDVLDGLGLVRQSLSGEFLPLVHGMRMAGPAFPIECRPNPLAVTHLRSARGLFELLSAVPPGSARTRAISKVLRASPRVDGRG